MDVLEGGLSYQDIVGLPLPDVLDMVAAKARLEREKTKAQKAAREMAEMNKGKKGFF